MNIPLSQLLKDVRVRSAKSLVPRFRHGATRASYFSFRPLSPSHPSFVPTRRNSSCPFRRARASAGRKTGVNITAIATSAAIPRVAIYVTRSRDLVAFALLRAKAQGGTGGGRIRSRRRRTRTRREGRGERKSRGEDAHPEMTRSSYK